MNADLIKGIMALSSQVRYVAIYKDGVLTSRVRDDLANASASESDKYEELLVNPTLLKLLQQRGNIDCGGMEYVVIRYGNFFELVMPTRGGHISVGLETAAEPLAIVAGIKSALAQPAKGHSAA